MKRFLLALAAIYLLFFSASAASAEPQFLDTLVANYPSHASVLRQRACTNCHVQAGDITRNAYGNALEALLRSSGGQNVTPAILKQAEPESAAPGAETFGLLINSNQNPAAIITSTSSSTSAQLRPPTKPISCWSIPPHMYHPAIVHFPIALFIAGLFLDFVGMVRKDKNLLMAGWYDLVLAAASALVTVTTGLAAFFRMHMQLVGTVRVHFLLALVVTVVMWSLVGLRAYQHERISTPGRIAYYFLAAANLAIIAYVGHLGGQLVYGS